MPGTECHPALAAHYGADPAALSGHGKIAVSIGAMDRDAKSGQRGEQARRGVAVVVVRTHADEADGGVRRGQEARIGVGRPVVPEPSANHVGYRIDEPPRVDLI